MISFSISAAIRTTVSISSAIRTTVSISDVIRTTVSISAANTLCLTEEQTSA